MIFSAEESDSESSKIQKCIYTAPIIDLPKFKLDILNHNSTEIISCRLDNSINKLFEQWFYYLETIFVTGIIG